MSNRKISFKSQYKKTTFIGSERNFFIHYSNKNVIVVGDSLLQSIPPQPEFSVVFSPGCQPQDLHVLRGLCASFKKVIIICGGNCLPAFSPLETAEQLQQLSNRVYYLYFVYFMSLMFTVIRFSSLLVQLTLYFCWMCRGGSLICL